MGQRIKHPSKTHPETRFKPKNFSASLQNREDHALERFVLVKILIIFLLRNSGCCARQQNDPGQGHTVRNRWLYKHQSYSSSNPIQFVQWVTLNKISVDVPLDVFVFLSVSFLSKITAAMDSLQKEKIFSVQLKRQSSTTFLRWGVCQGSKGINV